MTICAKKVLFEKRWCLFVLLLSVSMAHFSGIVAAQTMTKKSDDKTPKLVLRGTPLQKVVMSRCEHIAHWNRPYQYDGVGDCYGYCRQVWNAILYDGQEHAEDYYPNKYDKNLWINFKSGIPVNTFRDTNWIYFSSSEALVPGDLLATDQGHFWGENWHGGIYAGNNQNWDCSKHDNLNGAYKRSLFKGFHYYYKPLHELLCSNSPPESPPAAH